MESLTKKFISGMFVKQEALRNLSEWKLVAQEHFFAKKELTGTEMEMLTGITQDNLEQEFKKVEQEIDAMPELMTYLAFAPSGKDVSMIGKKARELFGESLFLNFKLDQTLIGGAALSFGGIYRDYSLRARFVEKKQEIEGIYKKYLQTS